VKGAVVGERSDSSSIGDRRPQHVRQTRTPVGSPSKRRDRLPPSSSPPRCGWKNELREKRGRALEHQTQRPSGSRVCFLRQKSKTRTKRIQLRFRCGRRIGVSGSEVPRTVLAAGGDHFRCGRCRQERFCTSVGGAVFAASIRSQLIGDCEILFRLSGDSRIKIPAPKTSSGQLRREPPGPRERDPQRVA